MLLHFGFIISVEFKFLKDAAEPDIWNLQCDRGLAYTHTESFWGSKDKGLKNN